MNIFILDTDKTKCSEYHVDRHAIKMVLETTQLLNNAVIQYDPLSAVYRQTHKNHPSSVWACNSKQNFIWLCDFGIALAEEYTYRYSKRHKCQDIIEKYKNCGVSAKMPNIGLTPFALCMPEQYKTDDAVESYRAYYKGEKANLAKWTKRSQPEWW